MSDIIYPTLDLFLYDMRNGLDESQDELNRNRDYFQKKLPEEVRESLFQFDKDFEAEYVELLAETKIKKFEDNGEPFPVEGYYYPVRLGDTYALQLDCTVNNQKDAQPVKCFAALKDKIEDKLNNETANIGQTWMISGQLAPSRAKSAKDIEQFARACYNELMPDSNWHRDLEGQGQFLGATVFELWRYRLLMKEEKEEPTSIQSMQDNQHVIIVLFPYEETASKAADFYVDWLRLFGYRNKILWAYGQSRLMKQSAREYFITIQEGLQSLKRPESKVREFKKLRQTLSQVQDKLVPYTTELTNLDFQSRTIDINLTNYKKRLSIVEKKSEGKLGVLGEFSDYVRDKYQLQLEKDYDNLELGLRVLEDTIGAVRSRVEIDNSERDRNFQLAVGIVGGGLAAGTTIAAISDQFSTAPTPANIKMVRNQFVGNLLSKSGVPNDWLAPTLSLVYSFTLPAIALLVTGVIIWLRKRSQ